MPRVSAGTHGNPVHFAGAALPGAAIPPGPSAGGRCFVIDCCLMDSSSLETLELGKILARLAGMAAFSASQELARALRPTSDLRQAREWQAETSEACRLLSDNERLSVGGARDVRASVDAAERGAVLEPDAILDVKHTLLSARSLQRTFGELGSQFPSLSAIAEALEPHTELINEIAGVLDERGEVRDDASPELASLRAELLVARERLTRRLQKLLTDPRIVGMLQEPIITLRDGRFVVPIRAEFKGKVKAVIHDQSSSGATLFVEPLEVVELNNHVRELELAERDEVRRLLATLSAHIGQHIEGIVRTVEALARLDLAFTKARLAGEMQAVEPVLKAFKSNAGKSHPGSTLKLHAARHPLLDPQSVVPVDLVLDEETYGLVITGPNTGGKTVTLKTAGLLALMAQCGLHIPAASGSELSVFSGIYADIGDEQSIEQSLSTFSSHIAKNIAILERADDRSLVLLDELGAGTDPQEGAALARAILDSLMERRITTLVATHYPELKAHAHALAGAKNASVEFNLESLRPTYRLIIGLPGRSNALAIAERLGLDERIVRRARGMLAPGEVQADRLLGEIHQQREFARRALTEAEKTQTEAGALREELSRRLQLIEQERHEVLEEAHQQAQEELEALGDEIRHLRRRLKQAARPLEEVTQIEREAQALEQQVEGPIPSEIEIPGAPEEASLGVGDRVLLPALQAEGLITALDDEQVDVQIGRLRVRARLDELAPLAAGEQAAGASTRRRLWRAAEETGSTPAGVHTPALELNLRGKTVDEALLELDRRLDAAYLAGMPFLRVVHGKGTGRLRQAVREALKDNAYVDSFESGAPSEGGDGVTVVRLAL
jgi:DNA mismatch repair protein MutS2